MRAYFRRLPSYLAELWRSATSQRRAWLCLAVLALALGGALLGPWCDEQGLRYGSLLLNLAGLCAVAVGLLDLRKTFDMPPLGQALRAELPAWRKDVTVPLKGLEMHVKLGDLTVSARGRLGRDESPEQAVQRLQREIDDLRQFAQQVEGSVREEADKRETAIAAERAAREAADTRLHDLVKTAVVGGLSLEAAGLVWLLVGTIMSTIASDFRCSS